MSSGLVGWLGGAVIGLGVFALLWALLPAAPINLAAALARYDALATTTHHDLAGHDAPHSGWRRLVHVLGQRAATQRGLLLGAPVSDLDLLGRTVPSFIAARLVWAGAGLVSPVLLWTVTLLVGMPVPFVLTAALALAAALLCSLIPALSVREDAQRAREDFRRAVSAYLDLVAQERVSGRSPVQALTEAAAVSQGWVFTRLRQALTQATRLGITPWEALTRLSHRVGVTELGGLADIMASAADGAAIYTTLTTHAASLRAAALATDKTQANERSERLVFPVTLLGLGFLILLLYQAFTRLLGA